MILEEGYNEAVVSGAIIYKQKARDWYHYHQQLSGWFPKICNFFVIPSWKPEVYNA